MVFLAKISHYFCWFFGRLLFGYFFNFEVVGKQNIKNQKGPLIVAFNHCSWLDPFLVMASIPPSSQISPIYFATWYKHYWKFFPFTFMAGAFPVKKKLGLKKSLKKGLDVLKKKGVVGIAPEERRRHLGRRRKGRRGAAFLALKTNSPILPIYIVRKTKATVVIGKSFELDDKQKIKKATDLDEFSNFIMDKIYQLKPNK